MAPSTRAFWHSVSCTSPVPGGRSIKSTSSSPQATCVSICWSAPISIGPRQITAWPSSTIRPSDMAVTPWARSGRMVLPSGEAGRPESPNIRGWEGP